MGDEQDQKAKDSTAQAVNDQKAAAQAHEEEAEAMESQD